MAIRPKVRDAQRTIAALDAAHSQAATRLDRVTARRAKVVAEQDRQVAAAEQAVADAVAEMARQLSVGLTAQMLGCDETEVRRQVKAAAERTADTGGAGK